MKIKLNLRKSLLSIIGVLLCFLPLEVNAAGENYDVGFKIYKIDETFFTDTIGFNKSEFSVSDPDYLEEELNARGTYDVFAALADLEEYDTSNPLNPGDMIIVSEYINAVGATKNATLFSLYYSYDTSIFEPYKLELSDGSVSPFVVNTQVVNRNGIFPSGYGVTGKSVDETNGYVSLAVGHNNNTSAMVSNLSRPFTFFVLKVKDSAGGKTQVFDYIYSNNTPIGPTYTQGSTSSNAAVPLNKIPTTLTIAAAEVPKSDDSTLKSLTITGGSNPINWREGFTAGSTRTSYSAIVPNAVSSVVIVGEPTDANAKILAAAPASKAALFALVRTNTTQAGIGADKTITLGVGDNPITFYVQAEDGSGTAYTLNVKRLDNDTSLNSVTLTNTNIALTYNSATSTYSGTTPYKTTGTTVTATLSSDSTATIDSGNGAWTLAQGPNTRDIVVSAEDCGYSNTTVPGNICTQKTYKVSVTRENPSNDANLTAISVDGVGISPFDSDTLEYTIDPVKNNKTSVNIAVTKSDTNATVSGDGSRSLTLGDNTLEITVTAEDGTTTKTYKVKVKRQSNDATLKSMSITPTPNTAGIGWMNPADFNKAQKTYTYFYKPEVTSVAISAEPTDTNATVSITDNGTVVPTSGGTAVITVTAEDGTTDTYTITFSREQSNDNTLKTLKVKNPTTNDEYPITPSLNSTDRTYNVTIPHEVSSVNIEAEANSSSANIISGTGTVNNIGFDTLERQIVVRAENLSTETYKLNITREKSDNAYLTDIKIDNQTIKDFNKETINYTLDNVKGNVNTLDIKFTKENAYSDVQISGNSLSNGNNTVTLTVTSQDKSNTKTYTLTVYRASNNTNLQSLTVDTTPSSLGSLNPNPFNTAIKTYTYNYDEKATSFTVNANAVDSNATVEITGNGNLPAVDGSKATVKVTAEDGTEEEYTITFKRNQSEDKTLKSLTVKTGSTIHTLSPTFAPDKDRYEVTIPHETTSVTFEAEANSSAANVTSGLGDLNITGFDPVTRNIIVTAENQSTKTYTVIVTRAKSDNADLTDLKVDGTTISGFDKDTLTYNYPAVNNNVTSLNITYSKANSYANDTIVAGTNNLVEGDNTVIVRVTSQDGSVTKEYKINVRRKSSNATLTALNVTSTPQGTIVETFNPATKEYTYKYDRTVTNITVNATPAANATVEGNGTYTIGTDTEAVLTVKAEDTSITDTYKVKFEQILETDSTLKSLVVKNGSDTVTMTPSFAPNELTYTLTVPSDVESVEIEAEKNGEYATLTGDGHMDLDSGANTRNVIVTAEDGTKTTYTLNITREISTSATLEEITIGGNPIPGFDPATATYTLDPVGYDVTTLDLGATPVTGATLSGTGIKNLSVGDNSFDITVTAEDGTTTGKYTVKVRRQSNDTSLSGLTATSTPASTVRTESGNYIVDVPSGVTTITLVPSLTDSNAKVTNLSDLTDIDITSITTVNIEVEAEDSNYTETHTITINKLMSKNVYLSSLTTDNGTLTPSFTKEREDYTIEVENNIESITLTATPEDSKSDVDGDGTHTLTPGENTITITVTAEDGTTTKEYTVVVTRKRKNTVTLSDLTIDGVTINDFAPDKTSYTITVPRDKTTIDIAATTSDSDANATGGGLGIQNITGETQTFSFIVTAQDGTTETYEITVNKEAADTDNTLSGLEVTGYPLTPEFDPNEENYDIGEIPEGVDGLVIKPTPGSEKSDITIKVGGVEVTPDENGKVPIPDDLGTGKIEVTVKAEDGTEKTYVIDYEKVEGGLNRIESEVHDIDYDEKYVLTVAPETTWDKLKLEFLNPETELFIFENDETTELATSNVKTGDTIKLIRNGVELDKKYIIIKGDSNGDGFVNISDASRIVSHDLEVSLLTGPYAKASDANEDGLLNISDASRIVSHDLELLPFVWGKQKQE